MNDHTRDVITWTLGTMLSVLVFIGMAVRFVLLPWLRDHLVTPVAQVKKQVTENHHRNQNPTVLDRIDDVQQEVRALADEVRDMQKGYTALAGGLGSHLVWSEEEVSRIWREIRKSGSASEGR